MYSDINEVCVLSKWPSLIDTNVEMTNSEGDRYQYILIKINQ